MKKISVLLTFLILVGIFVPAVSAEEFSEVYTESETFWESCGSGGMGGSVQEMPIDHLIIHNAQYIYGNELTSITLQTPLGTTSIPEYRETNFPKKSDVCRATIGNWARCDIGYFLYNVGETTWVQYYIDNIEYIDGYPSGYTGTVRVPIYPDNPEFYFLQQTPGKTRINVQPTLINFDTAFMVGMGMNQGWSYPSLPSVYTCVFAQKWENHLSVSTGNLDYVSVTREINGIRHNSNVTIYNTADATIYLKDIGNDDTSLALTPQYQRPYQILLTNPTSGNTYIVRVDTDGNIIYGDIDIPDDPDKSGVTVYVKNSQTGALIANANVVIDALVDGEYHTVTNRTEPSGIFTITLQPTGGSKPNPDGYRLIVTADGYNNPMPEINFTLGDYIKYFECFLDPIAGGPVNENKTFIDFFVRDMSSNPISGATVKFGKYTLITNSAGYTVFEVDKNNNYSWTISKSGYGPLTGNAVIGDAPRHTINTVLAPIVTPTVTTPIPTSPPIGPTPTMTAPSGEHVSNWLEWFAAHFGMILGGGVEIGKIFMWLCFTVPVGVYVGKEAKAGAAGFMAGAGIVTLFFVLIGWVPIWLLVLLALIIGLLYAKVFNSQDNGGGR